jgi:hypothetical protein
MNVTILFDIDGAGSVAYASGKLVAPVTRGSSGTRYATLEQEDGTRRKYEWRKGEVVEQLDERTAKRRALAMGRRIADKRYEVLTGMLVEAEERYADPDYIRQLEQAMGRIHEPRAIRAIGEPS